MKIVNKCILAGTALLVAAPALAAPGTKLSWFGDNSFAGVRPLGISETRLLSPDYASFGINLYSSRRNLMDEADMHEALPDANTVRLYGEIESRGSGGTGNFPSFESTPLDRGNVFGISWQHRLNALNSFAVSAEYDEAASVYPSSLDTLDARAAFSWTSRLSSAIRPSITGSVFLGDEMAREEIYRHLDRKYYGFSVGGSLTLFKSHTPYVSFKMQRSVYDAAIDDPLLAAPRPSDHSLLSAGWKWQVQRDVSLQAEASYGLGETPRLDPYSLERSRILFGTRFDFK